MSLHLSDHTSLQGWMLDAFREKVARDGQGTAGSVGAGSEWERLVAGGNDSDVVGGTVDAAGGQRTPERIVAPVADNLRDFVPTGWSWNGEYHPLKSEPFEESA